MEPWCSHEAAAGVAGGGAASDYVRGGHMGRRVVRRVDAATPIDLAEERAGRAAEVQVGEGIRRSLARRGASIAARWRGHEPEVAVLATTTEIPNDSVSFIKGMDAEVRAKVEAALLEIAGTEEGAALLNTLYNIGGLEAADDSFYDEFRADLSKAGLDIESLAQ